MLLEAMQNFQNNLIVVVLFIKEMCNASRVAEMSLRDLGMSRHNGLIFVTGVRKQILTGNLKQVYDLFNISNLGQW